MKAAPPAMLLRGRRVTIRPVHLDDHPRILAWQNQPEVAWWMDYGGPFTLEDIHASEARAREEGHPFVIEVDRAPIGRIGLNDIRITDGVCSLYVFIGEPGAWGRGFGRDAVMTMLEFAFETLGMHLVELWTLAANERAIRAYRACGFREDGRLRERSAKDDGARHDRLVMSIRRDEFDTTRRTWPTWSIGGPNAAGDPGTNV
jgi:RimJ/RimL family protein N-acetyltransferase